MSLKKKSLSFEQKDVLSQLSGCKVYVKNVFGENHDAIEDLLKQAKTNALIHLERNRLGQRLSLFEENNLYAALLELQAKLGLKKIPRKIECYDISHISGKFVYGSMVVFVDGKTAKKLYRLFKTKEQNNDFENLNEVLSRRFVRSLKGEGGPKSDWGLPDLIVIDGGKGQLSSVLKAFEGFGYENNLKIETEICSLAKREELVFTKPEGEGVVLEGQTRFLIQRIRDEAHRFAITNSRKARLKNAKKSKLDEINGIGEKTKKKLLGVFESVENLVENLSKDPSLVEEIAGKSITAKLQNYFGFKK